MCVCVDVYVCVHVMCVLWLCTCVCVVARNCSQLRSYTVQATKDGASNIGVVLYQRNFYVVHADETRTVEMFGRNPYPNGGMSVSWEGGIDTACYCHVLWTQQSKTMLHECLLSYPVPLNQQPGGSMLSDWLCGMTRSDHELRAELWCGTKVPDGCSLRTGFVIDGNHVWKMNATHVYNTSWITTLVTKTVDDGCMILIFSNSL